MLNLFNGQQNRAAYDQDLAAEHAVPILLSWRSIGIPRYADSECSDNDDGRGSLLLLSDNEEGLRRLSLSKEPLTVWIRSFLNGRPRRSAFVYNRDVIQRLEPNENLSAL